ncbi:MAG: hypothetical protein GKR90_15445 [Pseudomonadales bacterium]|nr:hypothetical protein [Pseudomonadales bacterium]
MLFKAAKFPRWHISLPTKIRSHLFTFLYMSVLSSISTFVFAAGPSVSAKALTTPPVVDGQVIGEAAWQGVQPATGFTQVRPFEGQPASQKTEVFIAFTDDALYIGVVCYDEAPTEIVISDSRRDSSMDDTDSFQILLDVFNDKQNGFVFGTTPTAVEYDGQVVNQGAGSFRSGGGGFNLNWDTSWSVESHIGKFGWSAEFEIPFKSLRYASSDVQTWGLNFQRNIRRNNEIVFWSPLARQHNLHRVSEAGSLVNLQPPAQRNLKVTPYGLGVARRGGSIDGTDYEEEFGIDAKWSITPSLTLDATYNTDFAQVEVDEIQVNLDRFSLFFPEKRPFFLENAGQFSVGTPREVELFFSRRIGVGAGGVLQPLDGGVRLSGKMGEATNLGLLHMRADGVDGLAAENDFTVARVRQEFANRSSIGGIFVNRDGDGSITGDADSDYNRTYAVDGKWGVGEFVDVEGYYAQTETPGMRGDDEAYRLGIRRNTPAWSHSAGYTKVGEDFNPEVGFLQRTNYEKADFFVLRRIRPADLLGLHEIRPHVAFRGFWDDEGFWETGFLHVDSHWEWRNGIEVHTGVNFTHEGVQQAFEINEGTFVLPGEYDHEELQLVFDTDQGKPISFESRYTHGGFFGGDRDQLNTSINFRSGDRFSSSIGWNYNDIDLPVANGNFEVNVGQLRLSYSFSPKILLQARFSGNQYPLLLATSCECGSLSGVQRSGR